MPHNTEEKRRAYLDATKERRAIRLKAYNAAHREQQNEWRRAHGKPPPPLFERWRSAWRRCYDPQTKDFARYGGRGIVMCERWHGFANFQADMLPTFQQGLTLERHDNDGPYSPENCYWATQKQQQRNRRSNVLVDTPWGEMPLSEAAERSGINYYTLWSRHQNGKPLFSELWADWHPRKPTSIFVETPWGRLSLREIAERTGIPLSTIKWRFKHGRKLFDS